MTINEGADAGPWPREADLLARAKAGELLDLGTGPLDPEAMKAWGTDRTVRASTLRRLLVDDDDPVHAKGVLLRGVRISGHLDLATATLRRPLLLNHCYLDGPAPALVYATASLLVFTSCVLAGLAADTLTVTQDMSLAGSLFTGPVSLSGAHISGTLECDGAKLNGVNPAGFALVGERLKVGGNVLLRNEFAAAGAVSLIGAAISGTLECDGAKLNGGNPAGFALVAERLKVGGDVSLRGEFVTAGAISLLGANITGSLNCGGAKLNGVDASGNALIADSLTVGQDIFLDSGFTVAGAIRLIGANVTGNIECSGAKLNGVDGDGNALIADSLTVGQDIFFDAGFTAAGALSLLALTVTGNFEGSGANLNGVDGNGNALVADGMTVGHDAFLGKGFTAAGGIILLGVSVTGNLECSGAKLTGADPNGNALIADNLKVGGELFLDAGFTAAGAVRLIGADITGNLDCEGAKLQGTNQLGRVLVADNLKVGGAALFRNGFTAAGALWLRGADIKADFDCRGAKLTGAGVNGHALMADNLKVGRDVCLNEEFTAAGTVSLESARIDGSLFASIKKPSGAQAQTAFHAPGMQIAHELRWEPPEPFTGPVNLQDAQVGQLKDDWAAERGAANGYWPSGGLLRLDGFTYTRLGGDHPATAKQRRGWIQSQFPDQRAAPGQTSRFAAQPYEQLATVYQQGGQDREARIIALARRQDIRRYGDLTWYRWTLNWLVDKTIKYGYQTWRAVLALAVVYLAAVMIFWAAQHRGNLIVPVTTPPAGTAAPAVLHCASTYPCFYPAGYAIDVVIPIINVHQASYWGPNGHAPWGDALTVFTWLGTAVGWALATLAVAGYTGLVRAADSI